MASYDTQPPPIFISLYLSPDSLLMAVHPSFRVLQHAADTDIILLAGLYDPGCRDGAISHQGALLSYEPFPYIIVR